MMMESFLYGMSLHVTVHVAPENAVAFFEAFIPVFEKAKDEPECISFEVYQDPEDPGTISWVEDWTKSPDWFAKFQITKDYYKSYLETTEPMFIKPREARFFRKLGPHYLLKVTPSLSKCSRDPYCPESP
ncbi:hypothetical protein F5Y14DRAFT_400990 [Nemania sp. NC0429]|nr:hypothetical protein F5Y14DRAFT_400990 [Nemania sp. NC0429]